MITGRRARRMTYPRTRSYRAHQGLQPPQPKESRRPSVSHERPCLPPSGDTSGTASHSPESTATAHHTSALARRLIEALAIALGDQVLHVVADSTYVGKARRSLPVSVSWAALGKRRQAPLVGEARHDESVHPDLCHPLRRDQTRSRHSHPLPRVWRVQPVSRPGHLGPRQVKNRLQYRPRFKRPRRQ